MLKVFVKTTAQGFQKWLTRYMTDEVRPVEEFYSVFLEDGYYEWAPTFSPPGSLSFGIRARGEMSFVIPEALVCRFDDVKTDSLRLEVVCTWDDRMMGAAWHFLDDMARAFRAEASLERAWNERPYYEKLRAHLAALTGRWWQLYIRSSFEDLRSSLTTQASKQREESQLMFDFAVSYFDSPEGDNLFKSFMARFFTLPQERRLWIIDALTKWMTLLGPYDYIPVLEKMQQLEPLFERCEYWRQRFGEGATKPEWLDCPEANEVRLPWEPRIPLWEEWLLEEGQGFTQWEEWLAWKGLEATLADGGAGIVDTDHTEESANKSPVGDEVVSEAQAEDAPWEQIPDHGWDRVAVRMWCEGYTAQEIGSRLGLAPGTVYNRLSKLRQQYPEASIPRGNERKRVI